MYIIGICGGTASGKTTFTQKLVNSFNSSNVKLISMDNFYISLNKQEKNNIGNIDFDSPKRIDFNKLYKALINLKNGKKAHIPTYDFVTSSRTGYTWLNSTNKEPIKIIIVEGIFALYNSKIRDLFDLKIFVDANQEVRLVRRIKRDLSNRGSGCGLR